jgi:hypothetical protein
MKPPSVKCFITHHVNASGAQLWKQVVPLPCLPYRKYFILKIQKDEPPWLPGEPPWFNGEPK